MGGGGATGTAQTHRLLVPGLLPVAAAAAAGGTDEAGDDEDARGKGACNESPAGPWGRGRAECIYGQLQPPLGWVIPTPLLGVPQLTGGPGDEVWNKPRYSCGASWGQGTGRVWWVPHLPTLLVWRKRPRRLGQLGGRPLQPLPGTPSVWQQPVLGLPGQGSSLGWPGARVLHGRKLEGGRLWTLAKAPV